MSAPTKLGLGILAAAVALGITGDALLKVSPWGLNIFAFAASLVIAVVILARWQGVEITGGGRWLALPVLFFAAALAWRDSLALGIVNVLTVLVALTLAVRRSRMGLLRIGSMLEHTIDAVFTATFAVIGPVFLMAAGIRWREVPRDGVLRHSLAAGLGLIIGIPLVILFGALFMAADAVFSNMITNIFNFDITDALGHIILSVLFAWIIGGLLYLMLMRQDRVNTDLVERIPKPLGIVEMGIVLGMLNILFLAFVVVQFRYFFGGAALVEASTNLTYAEYARRGFFELVTVAAFMLPLLLAADWAVRKENPLHRRIFHIMVVALVALLFVVMYSAFQRMRLYQQEFGLTELRLYTTVFMGWVGLVFLWFLATVVRGQRNRFAFGMLISGFLAVAFLNAVNPDSFIVRTNVNRVRAEQPLDARYVASLSADAVPALVSMLAEIPEKERKAVAENVLQRWLSTGGDFRNWNWGRAEAQRAVRDNEEMLRGLAGITN